MNKELIDALKLIKSANINELLKSLNQLDSENEELNNEEEMLNENPLPFELENEEEMPMEEEIKPKIKK